MREKEKRQCGKDGRHAHDGVHEPPPASDPARAVVQRAGGGGEEEEATSRATGRSHLSRCVREAATDVGAGSTST